MALSPAEKQRRYRERQRERASTSALAAVRRALDLALEHASADEHEGRTPADDARDTFIAVAEKLEEWLPAEDSPGFPALAEALGFPLDPWPGLTCGDLERMTRGRQREAAHRGLRIAGAVASAEATYFQRFVADLNREWLEAGNATQGRKHETSDQP